MLFYFLMSGFVADYNAEAAPIFIDDSGPPLRLRTLYGIIWSCITTIIICTWTAAHPDVPPPCKWKARWNRLRLMIWMIVVPELVLVWAIRQLFAAKEIRDEYNRSRPELPRWMKWTLLHGYMVQMGGFVIDSCEEEKDPNERRGKVLTFDDLKRLLQDPKFKFPAIISADIRARSKGDTLLKIIAILQIVWFIIQCIARGQQGLALTGLELVTLSLASLTAVTFAFSCRKPLGVQEPIRIYVKTEEPKVEGGQVEKNVNLCYSRDILKCWDVALTTKRHRWFSIVIFAPIVVILGGLPCIGWNFEYPTYAERTLWRAISLVITVVPFLIAIIDSLLATRFLCRDINSCGKFERIALRILDLIMVILLFTYIPIRLCLLAEALALLRWQPLSALYTIDWAKYVPHMFS